MHVCTISNDLGNFTNFKKIYFYGYLRVSISLCVHMRVCMCACVCTCLCVCMFVCARVYTRVSTHRSEEEGKFPEAGDKGS